MTRTRSQIGKTNRAKGARATIPWLPDYDFGADGEIRRITPAKTRGSVPYAVKGRADGRYHRVRLMLPDGSKKEFIVSRLICEAFHGAPFPGAHAAHWDGDPSNNSADNLRWATALENVGHDRTRHGRAPIGTRNGRAKLSEADVRSARRMSADGVPTREIARQFSMSLSGIRGALSGERWKHVR